ncbi:hypothetical protein [uncultured Nostoc sp.]
MNNLTDGVLQRAMSTTGYAYAVSSRRAIAFIFVYNLIYVTRRFTSNVD